MRSADWVRVLDQATELGVRMVQFIGGEPTLYPDLARLVDYAIQRGLVVEVFSNLVHVTNELWQVFGRPGVSLATSYYSDDPAQHAAVTGRPSYARTRANIAEAVRRGIPLRAGVIDLGDGQRTEAAQRELVELGVASVGYDLLRQVGRGVRDQRASVEQLCGNCGNGVAAISPNGVVWPCVFSRWLPVGNVCERELAEILTGPDAERICSQLTQAFAERTARACRPSCGPTCEPNRCTPDCAPACSQRIAIQRAHRAAAPPATLVRPAPGAGRPMAVARHTRSLDRARGTNVATMSGATEVVSSAEDDAHRAWMRVELAKAATATSATVVGGAVFGWRDRSLGARVRAESAEFWLRVVTEQEQWAGGEFWTGNEDADTITGVPKPRVLRAWEWAEGTARLRAELMTLADGQQCSPTPELRIPVELPGTWWRALRESLRTLAVVPTSRRYLTANEIARRLLVFFGDRADPTVSEWSAAHTDLHWANLMEPDLVIVDWEGWGIAPFGFDAATLYVHSLLQPAIAEQVRAAFNEFLEHRDGLISQLYVTTRMLLRIEHGDYPDLAVLLHRNAERVLRQLSGRR